MSSGRASRRGPVGAPIARLGDGTVRSFLHPRRPPPREVATPPRSPPPGDARKPQAPGPMAVQLRGARTLLAWAEGTALASAGGDLVWCVFDAFRATPAAESGTDRPGVSPSGASPHRNSARPGGGFVIFH